MIVFDNSFFLGSSNARVNGGQADIDELGDGCKNGASGTLWYKTNDTLIVDNREMNSTGFTMLRVPNKKPLVEDKQELAKKLYL